MPFRPFKPIELIDAQARSDNGYSSKGFRADEHLCKCPACKGVHPSARVNIRAADLTAVCDDWTTGLLDGPNDATVYDFLWELARRSLPCLSPGLACTCPGCGWNHTPEAFRRWLGAAAEVAEGGLPVAGGAGGRGPGAPRDGAAPRAAGVRDEGAPRVAAPVGGPAAPAPAVRPASQVHDPASLTDVLGALDELDERVHGQEQTVAALVRSLDTERAVRQGTIASLVRSLDDLRAELRALEGNTHGPTGHQGRIEDMERELVALRTTLQDTNTGAVLVLMRHTEHLRELGELVGGVVERQAEHQAEQAVVRLARELVQLDGDPNQVDVRRTPIWRELVAVIAAGGVS